MAIPILAIMAGIVLILLALGLLVLTWNFAPIGGSIIASVDNTLRSNCLKGYIDAGKTPEQALVLCPEKDKPLDMGLIILGVAAALGIAYILSKRGK